MNSVQSASGNLRDVSGGYASSVLAGELLQRVGRPVLLAEPDDAHLTGMTRSLGRRLLALNLQDESELFKSSR